MKTAETPQKAAAVVRQWRKLGDKGETIPSEGMMDHMKERHVEFLKRTTSAGMGTQKTGKEMRTDMAARYLAQKQIKTNAKDA